MNRRAFFGLLPIPFLLPLVKPQEVFTCKTPTGVHLLRKDMEITIKRLPELFERDLPFYTPRARAYITDLTVPEGY